MPRTRTAPARPATRRAFAAAVAAAAAVVVLCVAGPATAKATTGTDAAVTAFLAAHPDARRAGTHQVSWDGGAVVMTFPDRSSGARDLRAASTGCAAGWSCLYEHSDYGGRRLQFRDCGYTQHLGNYGFANAATSWINSRGAAAIVRDLPTGRLLWTAGAYARSRNVGSANDRADTIYLSC